MNEPKKTKLSPSTVAKEWGIGKTTVYRMMKDGELSFETNATGKRELDLSEIARVLGEPKVRRPASSSDQNVLAVQILKEQLERQDKTHNEHIKSLQTQITLYQEQVSQLLENQADTTKLLIHIQESVGQGSIPHAQQKPIESELKQEEPLSEPKPTARQPVKLKRSLFQRVLTAMVED